MTKYEIPDKRQGSVKRTLDRIDVVWGKCRDLDENLYRNL
jgi:hypothetical protein